MVWTVDSLRTAYRLTHTDELIASALADAGYQERRLLGERANGGTAEFIWRMRLPTDFWHISLGLPYQATELISITGQSAEDAYLSANGWEIRRPTWGWFIGGGAITARVRLLDDTAHRDQMQAAFCLETLGMPPEIRGRGWRRLLQDMRGPGAPGRLPDERSIIAAGPAAGDQAIHFGLVPAQDAGTIIGALQSSISLTFNLPTWTGREYIVFITPSDQPISVIQIAGFDQTAAFRRSSHSEGGTAYDEWRSRLAWNGAVASGASVRITR